jgi:hypothetical protein
VGLDKYELTYNNMRQSSCNTVAILMAVIECSGEYIFILNSKKYFIMRQIIWVLNLWVFRICHHIIRNICCNVLDEPEGSNFMVKLWDLSNNLPMAASQNIVNLMFSIYEDLGCKTLSDVCPKSTSSHSLTPFL